VGSSHVLYARRTISIEGYGRGISLDVSWRFETRSEKENRRTGKKGVSGAGQSYKGDISTKNIEYG